MLHLLAALPPEQRSAAVRALPSGQWRVETEENASAESAHPSLPMFATVLAEAVGPSIRVEAAWRTQDPACRDGPGKCPPVRIVGARVLFADGQRVLIEETREPPSPHPPRGAPFIANLLILAGILAVVAWFAVRLVLQPLRRLSQVAEAFGRDPEHPPMDESGPIELQQAVRTFNRMREHLRSYIEERTRILATITHDLKTPLTRVRLRLEQCEDERLRARLAEDVAAIQTLVNEGLALARSLDSGQPLQTIDLGALLQSLCDDAVDAGWEIRFEGPYGALIAGRPEALRHSLLNLIDNAVKYGREAEVTLERSGENWHVLVRDRGPGIPERHLDDVMQPFFRLETSRSRDTGGTSLGLPIAANLLAAQGGTLSLHNRPDGGFEARVRFPVLRSR